MSFTCSRCKNPANGESKLSKYCESCKKLAKSDRRTSRRRSRKATVVASAQ